MTGANGELSFDHVGIIAPDIDAGCVNLRGLLGPLLLTRRFDDFGLGVSVRFCRDISGMVYELIAPLGARSPVAATLASGMNLLNHVAYRTRSLEAATKRLHRQHWATPAGPAAAALAFGGARVQFMLARQGFLLELIETDRVVHEFGPAEAHLQA